jgi:hypothetical protein
MSEHKKPKHEPEPSSPEPTLPNPFKPEEVPVPPPGGGPRPNGGT